MIPPSFEYFAPETLPEAVSLLQKYGADAKILSGGQSLIPLMKFRFAKPRYLIDINRIPGLEYIKEEGGYLKIGALTREADLEASDLIRSKYPILSDTSSVIADPLVRGLATVGGNLAHGDPANDHPATMLALDAEVVAAGPKGERTIPIADFFTGPFATALGAEEILTEVRVPISTSGSGGAYFKVERRVGDYAIVGVAAQLTIDGKKGSCQKVGIGLTNVGPTPLKAKRAEEFLRGKKPDEANIRQAAQLAAEESQPSTDQRGSAEYKRDLVRILTIRALVRARERAGGG